MSTITSQWQVMVDIKNQFRFLFSIIFYLFRFGEELRFKHVLISASQDEMRCSLLFQAAVVCEAYLNLPIATVALA